ncbi:hypothetical protein [Variovorax sp. 3P27G3]|uniref:hypothetical protein n=1 Tax=Variovorax sp. 3P27G3 TaxID=2502214 RepID=UPI0010F62452|nr:hypothetical protein [Variovorax sp. 3P27G3]
MKTLRAPESSTLRNLRRRLERWELAHLREHAAELAQRVEQLEASVEQLEREVYNADACADMWRDSHNRLAEHLADGTADARCIGLTPQGDLLVVHTGALQ